MPGLVTTGKAAVAGARGKKPNIVMILVDDLGYGDLSSYGAKDLKSPNIDGLVAAGLRIDNFYANCPVCSPTRAALLTGRYPDMVGVPGVIRTHIENNWGYLSKHAVLLPKVLNRAGYHTAIVGKWHLGLESPNTPNDHGFDHFHGYLGDMMDDYYNHRRHGINYMRLDDKEIDPTGHATDLFTKWSIDYIRDRAKSGKPFFLYLPYNAPHAPIQPPKEWFEKVKKREKGISDKRAKLVALIEHLDDGIGKVVSAIKESGVADDTLIIFTSDNGGQVNVGATNGALRGGKQDMYEGGIKEPFCAVWPGMIKAGGRDTERVALTMDLYPTICEAAGATFEHEIDGQSILPALLGKEQPKKNRYLFWVRREGGAYGGRAYYAARYGDFKLVQNSPFEPMELYDLKNDPGEQQPLPSNHKMYAQLFGALRNHVIKAGAVPWEKYPVQM
ncbi:MAG: sulfatase-like hydrolase/transferase [Planctomycetes bacterium]|nr:sulfatase-like hydrolase/transferase [Planctomycetota bacterium]